MDNKSRGGVGDKPMPCKPDIAGQISGFSIKPLLASLRVLPSYNKHTIHKPSWPSTGPTHGKATTSLFCFVLSKQKAYFAKATQVWLAVNHNTSITS